MSVSMSKSITTERYPSQTRLIARGALTESSEGRGLLGNSVVGAANRVEPVKFSFVIPVKDERGSLIELYERITASLGDEKSYEVIFIDDGSRDDSWDVIHMLSECEHGTVRGLRFRRNAGKAAALTAGFRAARGSVVFTLDADLQDDPKEIHRFLARLAEGYDLVSGWKKVRHDPWHKVFPSRIFNFMLSRVSGVQLHDHNCGFKCYRAEVVKNLTLHGELHRMIPALAAIDGFRATEIVVEHHPRRHGTSKYGFERYLRGFVDMLVVGFFRKYRERPGHFVGGVSAFCGVVSLMLISAGLMLSVANAPSAAVSALLAGTMFLCTSLLGAFLAIVSEITIRGGLGSHWKLPIIDDTATSHAPMPGQQPRLAPVPLNYHCHRGTENLQSPQKAS